jgi:hypothetical protein
MKQAERRKYHYIYKISRFDGKYYIGLHSTDNLEDGYFGSGQLLWKSIKKHGKENHVKEILEFLPSRKALKLREKEIVNEELLGDKLCMNLKLGGEGGWDHIGNSAITKRAKTFHERNRGRGKRDGTNISIAMLGNTNAKSSPRFEGMRCSEEHRRKIGEKNRLLTGERNSQFGTCWINDGTSAIKIKKNQLDEYLKKGYSRGRKV